MTRNDFEGIPEVDQGETVKLLGVHYEDRNARRRTEYALEEADIEQYHSPRMMVLCKGGTDELNQAIKDAEEALEGNGELYVFEEETLVPDTGFEKVGEDQFQYEESFPESEEGEVNVGANSYFLSRSDLEPEGEMRMTDGDNYVDCNVEGGRTPTVTLEFEGSEEFAGRHSTAFSQWMNDALS